MTGLLTHGDRDRKQNKQIVVDGVRATCNHSGLTTRIRNDKDLTSTLPTVYEPIIEIFKQFFVIVIVIMIIESNHNLAHATTAEPQLSWQVPNCDPIDWWYFTKEGLILLLNLAHEVITILWDRGCLRNKSSPRHINISCCSFVLRNIEIGSTTWAWYFLMDRHRIEFLPILTLSHIGTYGWPCTRMASGHQQFPVLV